MNRCVTRTTCCSPAGPALRAGAGRHREHRRHALPRVPAAGRHRRGRLLVRQLLFLCQRRNCLPARRCPRVPHGTLAESKGIEVGHKAPFTWAPSIPDIQCHISNHQNPAW
ncbi:hypothetical protein N1851_031231 [Merluccius polli]|uniref:Uncharacterized protein n=1 Tax=Merluccius polli TaxID=89951 RepID=A0AA47NPF9_MERPO|nr:hypothetical protein N1851_031231 [Merluccius polli]